MWGSACPAADVPRAAEHDQGEATQALGRHVEDVMPGSTFIVVFRSGDGKSSGEMLLEQANGEGTP